MRLFIATFLSEANQAWYGDLAVEWCRRFPRSLRAVPAGSVHVTYAFLPHVDMERVGVVSSAIAVAAAAAGPVAVGLEKPGVLWAGSVPRLVEARIGPGAGGVLTIARWIEEGVRGSAPELECRAARSAHVTLARFRRGTAAADARRAGAMLGGEPRGDELRAVSLVESRLTAAGPVYRVVADHPMARAG